MICLPCDQACALGILCINVKLFVLQHDSEIYVKRMRAGRKGAPQRKCPRRQKLFKPKYYFLAKNYSSRGYYFLATPPQTKLVCSYLQNICINGCVLFVMFTKLVQNFCNIVVPAPPLPTSFACRASRPSSPSHTKQRQSHPLFFCCCVFFFSVSVSASLFLCVFGVHPACRRRSRRVAPRRERDSHRHFATSHFCRHPLSSSLPSPLPHSSHHSLVLSALMLRARWPAGGREMRTG